MKKLLCAVITVIIAFSVTGCWDSRELDTLFIVTGVGLDAAENQDELDVNVQIVRIADGGQSSGGVPGGGGGGGGSNDKNSNIILLEARGKSVLAALSTLRHESTRVLFLHHNQMIVFGKEQAQRGIEKNIDIFLRDEETRMETLVFVADGEAKEILAANLDQDKVSGVAAARIIRQYGAISSYFNVNMLKLVSALLQKTTAPLIPIIAVKKEENETKLEISKMAVFKEDKMTGEMNWDEITGFLWFKGDINEGILELSLEKGTAALNILQAQSTMEPVLQPDGRIGVKLNVDSTVDIEELNGFGELKMEDVYSLLIQESKKKIEERISTTFEKTKEMNADIYGIGGAFHIKYPKLWTNIAQEWDVLYPKMQLVLNVHVRLAGTGKTGMSLEMEENQE